MSTLTLSDRSNKNHLKCVKYAQKFHGCTHASYVSVELGDVSWSGKVTRKRKVEQVEMLQVDKVIVRRRFEGQVWSHAPRLARHIQTELYCELKIINQKKIYCACVRSIVYAC